MRKPATAICLAALSIIVSIPSHATDSVVADAEILGGTLLGATGALANEIDLDKARSQLERRNQKVKSESLTLAKSQEEMRARHAEIGALREKFIKEHIAPKQKIYDDYHKEFEGRRTVWLSKSAEENKAKKRFEEESKAFFERQKSKLGYFPVGSDLHDPNLLKLKKAAEDAKEATRAASAYAHAWELKRLYLPMIEMMSEAKTEAEQAWFRTHPSLNKEFWDLDKKLGLGKELERLHGEMLTEKPKTTMGKKIKALGIVTVGGGLILDGMRRKGAAVIESSDISRKSAPAVTGVEAAGHTELTAEPGT